MSCSQNASSLGGMGPGTNSSGSTSTSSTSRQERSEMLEYWQQDSFAPVNHTILQPTPQVSIRERVRQKRQDAAREIAEFERASRTA